MYNFQFLLICLLSSTINSNASTIPHPSIPLRLAEIFNITNTHKPKQLTCPGGTGNGNTLLTTEICSGPDEQGIIILITTNQIRVCFNQKTHHTIYTEHNLGSTIGGCQSSTWKSDFFLDLNPDFLYRSMSSENIQRGHLSPNCDFNTAEETSDTYYYINAAPMVQNLNAGAWAQVERQLRLLINNAGEVSVHVQTVSFGSQCLIQGRMIVPSHFIKIITNNDNSDDRSIVVGDNSLEFTSAVIIKDCEVVDCSWMSNTYPRVYCCQPLPRLLKRLNLSTSMNNNVVGKSDKRLFSL